MKILFEYVFFMIAGNVLAVPLFAQVSPYTWQDSYDYSQSIEKRIPPPKEYQRVDMRPGSFAEWLRRFPLKKGRPLVYLYDGRNKLNQEAHFAVLDIDTGKRNLQQCADAVIRLRAEYLYSKGQYDLIHFNFTSGHAAEFTKWAEGYRPVVKGNRVRWMKKSGRDYSYSSFRKYLDAVFTYAGSYSLGKELKIVRDVKNMKSGDVFIQGGFPGHAVIVMDMAVDAETGKKVFLLAQSYMPAQDIHILVNPDDSGLSPWYDLEFGDTLLTPEWTFTENDLKRF